ncbi:hypothetical protein [uncultured Pontibacter sp.]|uniref:hypothetical protein n=1 Tax=uncultured Pontibacter sp. TaxID=453356 RepID=UPI0026312947|nr:hypothetical protein [uncultured Pontibacter sp.]
MSQSRSQTLTVTYPVGTAAGTYNDSVVLDEQYSECQGVAAYESGNGGIPNYKIGLKDSSDTYQEQTHKDDWIVSTDVAPSQRIKPITPPIRGQKLTVVTQIPEVLTAELSYDIVFKLTGKKNR